MKYASELHSYISPRNMRQLNDFDMRNYQDLSRVGVAFDHNALLDVARFTMDSQQQVAITAPTMAVPVQFLQTFPPGLVRTVTAVRKIDEAIGMAVIGSWEDEQIVVTMLESMANAVAYGDRANIPLASFNPQFNPFNVVRLDHGLEVTNLVAERMSRVRINAAEESRISALNALEIARNLIGFYGYNSGSTYNYGLLNFPALSAYVPSPFDWSTSSFLEINSTIRLLASDLYTQSQGNVNVRDLECTLLLPLSRMQYLTVTSDFGISVEDWIKQSFPKMRVVAAPQLDNVVGQGNVMYMYAETVPDSGSDGGAVWLQAVPARSLLTGVVKTAKGFIENYLNATAGAICKRPYAVARMSGI